jgi:hypothetical protein
VVGDGRALHRAVVDADLEGIVAKGLGDAITRSWRGGTRSSTAATRSAAAVPSGFASAADAMPDTG